MRSQESIWYKVMMYGLEFIGLYYGSYRAFVANNDDPDKMNRLQLIVPNMNASAVLEKWAWPSGIWGAKNYGMQLLPQVGDMVWVEFENGNSDYPVWKHAGYAKEELPIEFKTPKHYGFKTPQGSIILINDNKGEEQILVKHSNGKEYFDLIKEKLELEAKLIKLGKNGKEWAAMGETTKAKLEDLIKEFKSFIDKYKVHKHLSTAVPPSPDDLVQAELVKTNLTLLNESLPEMLSDKVKIDK